MGQIFQRTYRAADGTRRTCATYSVRYFRNGRPHQEHGFTTKTAAKKTLQAREGDIAHGLPVSAAAVRVRFDDAAKDVLNDYAIHGKRSARVVTRRIDKHLGAFFTPGRLVGLWAYGRHDTGLERGDFARGKTLLGRRCAGPRSNCGSWAGREIGTRDVRFRGRCVLCGSSSFLPPGLSPVHSGEGEPHESR